MKCFFADVNIAFPPNMHEYARWIPIALGIKSRYFPTFSLFISNVRSYMEKPQTGWSILHCIYTLLTFSMYEGWNFNSGNFLFTTNTN